MIGLALVIILTMMAQVITQSEEEMGRIEEAREALRQAQVEIQEQYGVTISMRAVDIRIDHKPLAPEAIDLRVTSKPGQLCIEMPGYQRVVVYPKSGQRVSGGSMRWNEDGCKDVPPGKWMVGGILATGTFISKYVNIEVPEIDEKKPGRGLDVTLPGGIPDFEEEGF